MRRNDKAILIDEIIVLFEKSPARFSSGETWAFETNDGQKVTLTFDLKQALPKPKARRLTWWPLGGKD
jgi:hypothetical protein